MARNQLTKEEAMALKKLMRQYANKDTVKVKFFAGILSRHEDPLDKTKVAVRAGI